MSLDPLLLADLSHALNGESDAVVSVETVGYARFEVLDVRALSTKSVPGIFVVFEKDGERFVAQLTLYAGERLGGSDG